MTTYAKPAIERHAQRIAVAIFLSLACIVGLRACAPKPALPPTHVTLMGHHASAEALHAKASAQLDTALAVRWDIEPSLAKRVRAAATKAGVPTRIAFPLIYVESRFKPRAHSWAGARGLTQVMPATGLAHCGLAPAQLWLVDANLACGFSFLAMLHGRFGSWQSALAAYNAGPARFARAHLTGEYSGLSYAQLVMRQ